MTELSEKTKAEIEAGKKRLQEHAERRIALQPKAPSPAPAPVQKKSQK